MTVVCAGDSLTRAQVSSDYVAMLRARWPGEEFVNEGVNYDLCAGLLGRLDPVVAAAPSVVTVLIGTNDVRFGLDADDAEAMRQRWHLTEDPTPASYRRDLAAIVATLRDRTDARIALLSLPPLGQAPDSAAMRRVEGYNGVIREVATDGGVAYLPLHERMVADLAAARGLPATPYRPGRRLASTAAMQHFLLRRRFDAISRSRHLRLTTDTVHLNSRGAGMIADLIGDFVAGRVSPAAA